MHESIQIASVVELLPFESQILTSYSETCATANFAILAIVLEV